MKTFYFLILILLLGCSCSNNPLGSKSSETLLKIDIVEMYRMNNGTGILYSIQNLNNHPITEVNFSLQINFSDSDYEYIEVNEPKFKIINIRKKFDSVLLPGQSGTDRIFIDSYRHISGINVYQTLSNEDN